MPAGLACRGGPCRPAPLGRQPRRALQGQRPGGRARDPRSRRGATPCYAAVQRPRRDDIEPYAGIELAPLPVERWASERAWVAGILQLWLDEEWVQQDVHRKLGDFAAKVYVDLRAKGENEATDVLMGTTQRLLAFNFRETFVSPFEVSNKLLEVVMLKEGREVSCEPGDRELYERYQQAQPPPPPPEGAAA